MPVFHRPDSLFTMRLRTVWLVATSLATLMLAACSGGMPAEPTALPPETVPDQPTLVFPTFTPIPPAATLTPVPVSEETAAIPVGTPTPESALATGRVNAAGLRFRTAPDTATGEVRAELALNETLYVYGRNEPGDWLLAAREAEGERGWVYAPFVSLERPVADLPVAGAESGPAPDLQPAPTPRLHDSPLLAQFYVEAVAVPLQDLLLLDAPGGNTVTQVSAEDYVTAMARSADGLWLAVYTDALLVEDRQFGWVNRDQVKLYGGGELPVAESDTPWLRSGE